MNNIDSLQNFNLTSLNKKQTAGSKNQYNPALRTDEGDTYSFSTNTNIPKTKSNPVAKWFKSLLLATALTAGTLGPSSCIVEHGYDGKDVVITNDVTIDMSVLNNLLQQILDKLDEMNNNIVGGNEALAEQIAQLTEELKNGQIDDEMFFEKIIELLGQLNENVTVGDSSIQELLEALLKQYEQGDIDYKELLNQILDLLGSIDSSLTELVGNFSEFVNSYNENNEKYQQNFDQMLNWMSDINSSIKNNHIDMSEIEEIVSNITINGGATQEALDKILQAIIDVKNSAEANKPITVEDLENVLKKYVTDNKDYTEILNTIKDLIEKGGNGGSSSNITIEELEQIIKENKTDLSGITELMNSIIESLGNLNNGGSDGGDITVNVDLSTIEGMLSELINKFDQGRLDENELLEEISGKLDNMVTVEDLDALLGKYYNQLKADNDKYTENILDAIKDITISGGSGVDMDALEELIAKYATNNDDIVASLDKIYNKMDELAQSSDDDGSGITIRDLENLIQQYYKDPTPILTEIKGLLQDLGSGDRITIEELEQLLNENKTDLTKVTQLMSDILKALQNNSNNGVDMSSIENTLNSLIKDFNSGRADISSTLEKILDQIQSVNG